MPDSPRSAVEKEREEAIQRVFERFGADLQAFVNQVEHEKALELLERSCAARKATSPGLSRVTGC